MKPFKSRDEIYGNWATLLLPINSDDSIDFKMLADELDYLAESKVDGVYTNGTAGEFYNQSPEEFVRIQELTAEICGKAGVPYQIGASHPSPDTCLERIAVAAGLKPGAIQLIFPDWFPVNMDAALRFLRRAAEIADGIPLVVYNPPHAKVGMTPEQWKVIADEVEGVLGIKVAGGGPDWYREMRPVMKKLSVFIPGHFLATGIANGAMGAYSNMACLHPRGSQRWYDMIESDLQAGLEFEKRVCSFMDDYIAPWLAKGYPNHACDKCMAVAGGWLPGLSARLRFPYSFIDDESALGIGKTARSLLPEFFEG